MTNFLSHIINRHLNPVENIKPRINSRFDRESFFPGDERTSDEQIEERISLEKQPVKTNAATSDDSLHVSQNITGDKIPGAVYEKDTSPGTESIQPKKLPGNKIQQQSINRSVPPEKTEAESRENKPVSVREKIISRLQTKYAERYFDTKDEEATESNSKMITRPKESLPVLKEINEPPNDDNKPAMLKDKGSANSYSPMPFVNNKSEKLVPKISLAKSSSQTINISIDRIEIKAQFPQPETKVIIKKEDRNILSLDQYLESRKSR
jgi:hypothetical protein